MSTYTSEPGTRLAGRYRLVDQVNEGPGWTYWKATDEALARFVSVLTFANGFPRIGETVTAHFVIRAVDRAKHRLTIDSWIENAAGERVVEGTCEAGILRTG